MDSRSSCKNLRHCHAHVDLSDGACIQLSTISPDAAFELVDVLVANAQTAVHMICESITSRILGTSEKSKKQAINPNLWVNSGCNRCHFMLNT